MYSLKVMILNKREFSCSKRMAVADPGERSGSPPYFWTKLRPEGPNKNFFKTAPSLPYLKSVSTSGWCSQRKSLPTELPDNFKDRDTQDGIIFKDPKCVISISTRPKDKEKPNNNISVGKDG